MRTHLRPVLSIFFLAALVAARAQTAPPTTPPVTPPANTAALTADQKTEVLKGIKDLIDQRAFVPGVDFSKWDEDLAKHKDDLDKAETIQAFSSVINGALRDFGLSHIRLLSPRAAAARTRTSTVGTGVAAVPDTDGLKVRNVAEAGPAKAAGLETGDVITKVNGKKPENGEVLNGDPGTKMDVEVKKANGEVKTVQIEIKEYSTVRKETLKWIGDDTAVLRIFTFSNGYDRENIESLIKEANTKAKYLILDLRSNGGGAVNNLNHLLSLLMPDATPYGTFVSRTTYNDYVKANPDKDKTVEAIAAWSDRKTKTRARPGIEPFKGKIAVLLNRGSASASEICAASLKEGVGAKFVGTRSAGAVLASTFAKLPEGFSLQFPVSDFLTAKGERLEKNPRVPDEEVTGSATADSDPVVDKAVEILKKG
jgi:carboxyl-terminal processing protease